MTGPLTAGSSTLNPTSTTQNSTGVANALNDNSPGANFPTLNPPQMKTLVYSPDVQITIAHGSQMIDVSKDLVRGQVVRKENSASSLFFTLANHDLRYTSGSISRMDRVNCFLTRATKVQVFSGYLDTIPWMQAYPGTVDFAATCTLKRLLHTWWNPGLPQSLTLFDQINYRDSASGDNGIGDVLKDILTKVGNWTPNSIHIQTFPQEFLTFLNNYMVTSNMAAKNEALGQDFSTLLLGSNLSPGPHAAVGYQPSDPPGAAVNIGTANTSFYVTQFVAAADARGMNPTVDTTADNQTILQTATALSSSRDQQTQVAGQQLTQFSNNQKTQNNASDAAILALACAMVTCGNGTPNLVMNANNSVPESLTFTHTGLSTNGSGVGLFNQPNDGNWGTVTQRMNPYSSVGMFLDRLTAITGWRNMDPGQAIQTVQNGPATDVQKYDAAVPQATTLIQAYRTATQGGSSAASTALAQIPGAGGVVGGLGGNPLSSGVTTVMGAATTSPTPAAAANSLTGKPNPDTEGAINAAYSMLGTPYSQTIGGGTTPGVGLDCLVAGTLVTTSRGQVPIEQLSTEDRVLTRRGYRRVLAAWKVRDDAPTVELKINGHTLRGTADHRVWTENRGWSALESITSLDTLVLWETQSESSSWASPTTDTRTPALRHIVRTSRTQGEGVSRTGRNALGTHCIGRSGNIIMVDLSRMATRSITSTTTHFTTTLRTSIASNSLSIEPRARLTAACTTMSARNAGPSSRPSRPHSVPTGSVARSTSRSTTTVRTGPSSSVYDVMVEGEHEFFANGVLVHNCSGLVQNSFKAVGISLGRNTYAQINDGVPVPPGNAQRGDVLQTNGGGHTGIYLGGNMWIQTGGPDGTPGHIEAINPATAFSCRRMGVNGGQDPAAPWTNPMLMGPGGTPGTGTGGTGGVGANPSGDEPIARNLFSEIFEPGFYVQAAADLFTGEKSYIDGQPLMQVVTALAGASLRNFQSSPTGDLIFYYPDPFGMDGKPAIFNVEDVELTDCHIDLSDNPMVTHAYVEGDLSMVGQEVTTEGWLTTSGVATVENKWLYQRLIRAAPGDVDNNLSAQQLMNRFGVRPYRQTYQMAGNADLEFLLACQIFMGKWASQYETQIGTTFLPELYPGFRINLVGHDLACYVGEVTHVFDWEQGFKTMATVSAAGNPKANSSIFSSMPGFLNPVQSAPNASNTSITGKGLFGRGYAAPLAGGPLGATASTYGSQSSAGPGVAPYPTVSTP